VYKRQLLASPIGQVLGGPQQLRSLQESIEAIGIPAAHAGMMQSGRLGQSERNAAIGGASGLGAAAMDPRLQALQMGINPFSNQGLSVRQSGGFEGGGLVEGPSQPPDQVPIMAQGGEGVVPLDDMQRLEMIQTPEEAYSFVRELQDLMFNEPPQEKACGGPVKMQQGGGIPTGQQNLDVIAQSPFSIQGTEGPEPVSFNGVPLTGPMSPEQELAKRKRDAIRRVSLMQSAQTLDPGGAPRLGEALSGAQAELQTILAEEQMIEQNKIEQQNAQARMTQAEAYGVDAQGRATEAAARAKAIGGRGAEAEKELLGKILSTTDALGQPAFTPEQAKELLTTFRNLTSGEDPFAFSQQGDIPLPGPNDPGTPGEGLVAAEDIDSFERLLGMLPQGALVALEPVFGVENTQRIVRKAAELAQRWRLMNPDKTSEDFKKEHPGATEVLTRGTEQ